MKIIKNSLYLLLVLTYPEISLYSQPNDFAESTNPARPSTLKTLAHIQKGVASELQTLLKDQEKSDVKDDADLHTNLEQLHDTACEIKRQTSKLLKSPKRRSASVWDSMFHEIEKSQKAFGNFFSDVRKSFGSNFFGNTYKITESESEDGAKYILSISMPGFSQEHINVSIEEVDKNKQITHTLKVRAQADVQQKNKSTSEGKTVITHSSQQMSSNKFLHGRRQSLDVKNGFLKAAIDLPKEITHDVYTMTFENNELIIEFNKVTPEKPTTKALSFKK